MPREVPGKITVALRDCLHDKTNWVLNATRLFYIGLGFIVAGSVLVLFGAIWVEPTGQFINGNPAWLGSQDLIIPALIFWGFPWVGTVGVLIYLSGLQNISNDVYEAAELDGVSPIGMVPGLYMFSSAFSDCKFGYACALGMIFFRPHPYPHHRLPEIREG